MAIETKEPEVLVLLTNARREPDKVPFHEFVMDYDLYCHRDPNDLSEANLENLMKNIQTEGLQVPPEVYFDEQGRPVVLKGHRRLNAVGFLIKNNTPGFTPDMEIDVLKVVDSTPQDRIVHSIADNAVRQNFDRVGRIRAAKKLYDARVQNARAARALGVSVKTLERDLIIAQHPWMFQHVIDGSIEATNATLLLEEASKPEGALKLDRLAELREDLDAWIADMKRQVRAEERLRKEQNGKPLTPAERQVKRYMTRRLVAHWLDCLRAGRRLEGEAQWSFPAGFDQTSKMLRINAISMDIGKVPLVELAGATSKLSQISKQLIKELKKRKVLADHQDQLEPDDSSPHDLDLLRGLGLDDIAKQLEEATQVQPEEEPEGEVPAGDDADGEGVPGEDAAGAAGEVGAGPLPGNSDEGGSAGVGREGRRSLIVSSFGATGAPEGRQEPPQPEQA